MKRAVLAERNKPEGDYLVILTADLSGAQYTFRRKISDRKAERTDGI